MELRDSTEMYWRKSGPGRVGGSLQPLTLQGDTPPEGKCWLALTTPPEAGHSGSPVNVCSCPTEAEMLVRSVRGRDQRTMYSRDRLAHVS